MLTTTTRHVGYLEKPVEIVRMAECRLPWAWDGLCVAFPFVDKGYGGWREIISGVQPSSVVGTVTGGLDTRGQITVKQAGGGSNYIEYADQPKHRLPTTAITVVCRYRFNGTNTINDGLFSKVHTDSTSDSWCVFTPQVSPFVLRAVTQTSTSWTDTQSTGTIPTNVWINVVYRWRTNVNSRVDVYYDGGAVAATAGVSSTPIGGTMLYSAAGVLRVFSGASTHRGPGGDLSMLMTYHRWLSDAEVIGLASDPFGWFTPRNETVVVAAPFPFGPGLASPGMAGSGMMGN